MNGAHNKQDKGRKARRFGAFGEEWVVVLFLFVATVGLIAEQAVRLGGGAGIV